MAGTSHSISGCGEQASHLSQVRHPGPPAVPGETLAPGNRVQGQPAPGGAGPCWAALRLLREEEPEVECLTKTSYTEASKQEPKQTLVS